MSYMVYLLSRCRDNHCKIKIIYREKYLDQAARSRYVTVSSYAESTEYIYLLAQKSMLDVKYYLGLDA